MEAIDSSTQCLHRSTALHQYVQQTVASAPTKSANEVSDDSCDAESHISFGSLGLSFLRRESSSRDEDDSTGDDGDDGRWNIPFDDTNEDDLVPKSADHALPLANALRDIGFKSIEDVDTSDIADGMATLAVSSPAKPTAARSVLPFRLGVSPIVPTARRGIQRVDSNGSEKENVDPIRKRLSIEKCSSQGFGSSPCR